MAPLVLVNAVGLTPRLLPHAPCLHAVAHSGWLRPLREVVPAVTCTAQAAMLTGQPVSRHGIVGNGWLYRETGEVRFWQQSNRLLQAEPLYETARRVAAQRGQLFRSAKLFWWFNQGAAVDISVTPKPYYGCDGNKMFGIQCTPSGLAERLERKLGVFPFHTFWGPSAGLPCTQWIGQCAAEILLTEKPDLTLMYMPHLDYDPQRHGPDGCDMRRLVGELDAACVPLLDAAVSVGVRVWIVSEYGHVPVRRVVQPNRCSGQRDSWSFGLGRSAKIWRHLQAGPLLCAIINWRTSMFAIPAMPSASAMCWPVFPEWLGYWSARKEQNWNWITFVPAN